MNKWISLVCLIGLLALVGCGQKGDLYQSKNVPPPPIDKTATQ